MGTDTPTSDAPLPTFHAPNIRFGYYLGPWVWGLLLVAMAVGLFYAARHAYQNAWAYAVGGVVAIAGGAWFLWTGYHRASVGLRPVGGFGTLGLFAVLALLWYWADQSSGRRY